MKAMDIRPGDVLDMAVGPTLVCETKWTHGGVECKVPRSGRDDSPYLWFYAVQGIRVLRRDPSALAAWEADRQAQRERLAAFKASRP